MAEPAAQKWWGWGDPSRRVELSGAARKMLRDQLGEAQPAERAELDQVAMPPARELPAAVTEAVNSDNLLVGHEQRLRHAAGKGYADLVRMRAGRLDAAPDAVAMPGDADQLAGLLAACASEGVAVVPFGGGTSVVGGVDPYGGAHERVISVDLGMLTGIEIDPVSLTARLGAGLRGPAAEKALGVRGYTLGHFPQSFEYATIGGFAATRSAGQASSGYGRFDELVTSLTMQTPAGRLQTLATPHTAAGPSLRQLALGSEGVLGVITEVGVRIRPAPGTRRYEAWMVEDFRCGSELVRRLAQADVLPDVTRLSDQAETRVSLALSGASGAKKALFDTYLRVRRRQGGCLLICGWEGEREAVERRRALSARMLRRGGGVALGESPGRSWERGRYDGPYLRDELMDLGYMIETLESSHTWSQLEQLYTGVGRALETALRDQQTPGIVLCHLSHAYRDGASLYFTFIARRRPGAEIEQWRAVKRAACEAIVAVGATITHHHAVGSDHAPYMAAEVGETGLEALRAVKQRLDPAGIMNPGKLLPD